MVDGPSSVPIIQRMTPRSHPKGLIPKEPAHRSSVNLYDRQWSALDKLAKQMRYGKEGRSEVLRQLLDEALEKYSSEP